MAPAFPSASPPTKEQQAWLRANKNYLRMSHIGHVATFASRGTLRPDGTFIAEAPGKPVMDGNGSFGVGIPAAKRRR